MTSLSGTGKACVLCGCDCAGKPRVKDSKGRYYCKECHERAARSQRVQPVSQPQPKASVPQIDVSSSLPDWLELQAPPVASSHAKGDACPRCRTPLPRAAVLCTACGVNLQSGQQLQVQKLGPKKPRRDTAVFAQFAASPALGGLVVAGLFGAFFVAALVNSTLVPAFFLTTALFTTAMSLVVLILAFRESIIAGILTLVLPFYILYFVVAYVEHAWVRILYGISIVANIAGVVLAMSALNEITSHL